jgi:hypothetical protein
LGGETLPGRFAGDASDVAAADPKIGQVPVVETFELSNRRLIIEPFPKLFEDESNDHESAAFPVAVNTHDPGRFPVLAVKGNVERFAALRDIGQGM